MTACSERVAAFMAAIVLTACNDGLIYSEWTSINLASARINADPATPVAIKLGFDRNVVAVAPPMGGTAEQTSPATIEGSQGPGPGISAAESTEASTCELPRASSGEAVSEFSTFSVNVSTPFIGTPAGAPTGASAEATAGTPAATPAETADWRHTWVHSRFASGAAALEIACKPEVVAAIMGLTSTFVRDAPGDLLRRFWNPDGTNINTVNQKAIRDWMDSNGLRERSITSFIRSEEDAAKREEAVRNLGLE